MEITNKQILRAVGSAMGADSVVKILDLNEIEAIIKMSSEIIETEDDWVKNSLIEFIKILVEKNPEVVGQIMKTLF